MIWKDRSSGRLKNRNLLFWQASKAPYCGFFAHDAPFALFPENEKEPHTALHSTEADGSSYIPFALSFPSMLLPFETQKLSRTAK